MEQLLNFLRIYSLEITLAAAILSLISFILLAYNLMRTNKIMRKYKRLMRGVDNKNLEIMLYKHLDALEAGMSKIDDLDQSYSALNKRLRRSIQNVGVIRYNAFDGMGSDQSFSLALLDENSDGFVLTSLYGRNASTTFAKPIKGMQSSYPLSDEEKKAIEQAF
ncbi:MAG: DUF4446 family protein [Clostridiales bacterium]|nr:DUF4446 family protein [Clostridiales bacterium]